MLFDSEIKLDRETVTDLFIFEHEVKVVGYVAEDSELDARYVNFTEFKRRENNKTEANFQFIETKEKIDNLFFNYEESCYLFHQRKTFYKFAAYEHYEQERN